MTKTVLLTGGAGFIGSAMVHAFAARGDKVIVLDKLTYAGHRQNLEWIKGSWELIEADIYETDLSALFKKYQFDVVVHSAAESHVTNSIESSNPFIATNIVGTHRLLEAARMYWQKLPKEKAASFRFLHVSTDEVYGTLNDGDAPFTTRSPFLPNSPYSASKAAADHLVRAWHSTYGLPVLTTRCCNNYGPRQHFEKLIPRMIMLALDGQKLTVHGDGRQVREWIHADDHARGVIAALAHGVIGEAYHLGTGIERRTLPMVELICDLLAEMKPGKNYRALITHVADRPGNDFRYALEYESTYAALRFTPQVEFESGVRETVRWYLENPKWLQVMIAHQASCEKKLCA